MRAAEYLQRDKRGRRDERGAAMTVALVWMFPLVLVLMMMTVQAALWHNANENAIAITQRASANVARLHNTATATKAALLVDLQAHDIENPTATITNVNGIATVVVTGRAPGILIGTHVTIRAAASEPIEGWRTP